MALEIRELLDEVGLRGLPKTSGGDGLHIFVPIEQRYPFEEVRAWLEQFIAQLAERYPERVTSDKRLSQRAGKVLIDYSQNAVGKSIVAPYSVRARPGAPVSAPLRWEEVEGGQLRPTDFTLRTIHDRLTEQGDLFAEALLEPQPLATLRR